MGWGMWLSDTAPALSSWVQELAPPAPSNKEHSKVFMQEV